MHNESLSCLLSPRSVAVVGASETLGKVGYSVLYNLLHSGYTGTVHAVNSRSRSVQDHPAFASLKELPNAFGPNGELVPPVDLAVLCTPSATIPQLIRECGELGIPAAVVLTAGFRELGSSGAALEDQIRLELKRFPNLRILGPNCLGIINPKLRLSASFAIGMPLPGSVAFLSQSGALCTAFLDWAIQNEVGFSHFLSLGNQLDVGFAELLDHLADDPNTTAAILYVESVNQARPFLSAARKFARHKPLIAYKAGRFAESAAAAASHTGAMAGVDAVYQAALDRAGIVRVFDMQSLIECAELLTQHPTPIGSRLAIVTNAGGPGVMATDALLEQRGTLATLSPQTLDALDGCLPVNWSKSNPVDVIGDADANRYSQAVKLVLNDPSVDTVLAILTPQAMTDPTRTAQQLCQLTRPPNKTLIASWMGGNQMSAGIQYLHRDGIPHFATPEQAIDGLMKLSAYTKSRARLIDLTPTEPPCFSLNRAQRSALLQPIPAGSGSVLLDEVASKHLLEDYGIPTTPIRTAATADTAVSIASELGYPVVMKIHSPQITHKTDVHGVALNLQNESQIRSAFSTMMNDAARLRPDAELLGVTVQPMVTAVHGIELILGAKRDPVFGAVILVGSGGITAEIFNDRALELPPLHPDLARRMMESLRCWPLLNGFRGRKPIDLDRWIDIMMRFSTMIVEQPRILEADLNPIVVSERSQIALDARFVIGPMPNVEQDPYPHLAIPPLS